MGVLKQSVAEAWGQGDNLAESARNVANVFNPFYQFPKEAQAAAKAYDAGQLEQAGAHGFAAAGAAAGALAPAGALAKIFASGSGGGLMPALAVAGGGTETAAAGTAVAAGGEGFLGGLTALATSVGNDDESPSVSSSTPRPTKTLAEWLNDRPELLEEARKAFKDSPEWFGIDPDKTPVFLRTKEEVDAIRAMPGEQRGHHPHGLMLGGPEGQTLTITGDTKFSTNPKHAGTSGLQRRIISAIRETQ